MDYEQLKEVIAKKIKENGRREITGPVLQAVLMAMVDSLGEVYPQNYTDEQKAQARANIDALSDYDGAITKEKLSAEVQAILDDVANKQNITDASLATIAKTIVGAINEVYKGGLKDASIATSKIEDGAITEPKLDTDLVNIITSAVQPAELASAIATALASYVAKADIVDNTGSATDKVMSQHGVTEAIDGVTNKVTELELKTGIIYSKNVSLLQGIAVGYENAGIKVDIKKGEKWYVKIQTNDEAALEYGYLYGRKKNLTNQYIIYYPNYISSPTGEYSNYNKYVEFIAEDDLIEIAPIFTAEQVVSDCDITLEVINESILHSLSVANDDIIQLKTDVELLNRLGARESKMISCKSGEAINSAHGLPVNLKKDTTFGVKLSISDESALQYGYLRGHTKGALADDNYIMYPNYISKPNEYSNFNRWLEFTTSKDIDGIFVEYTAEQVVKNAELKIEVTTGEVWEGIKRDINIEKSIDRVAKRGINKRDIILVYHQDVELDETSQIIPSESLFDIALAKKGGFDFIEANVHKCSDGIWVVKHGLSGTLGKGLSFSVDYINSSTLFSEVSSEQLRQYVRYSCLQNKYSNFTKYNTYIPTLEEFCAEANRQGIGVLLQVQGQGREPLDIARKYLNDDKIILDGIGRPEGFFGIVVAGYKNVNTTADVNQYIEECKSVGYPAMYGIKNYGDIKDNYELISYMTSSFHENGFMLSNVYITPNATLQSREQGFDINVVASPSKICKPIDVGNNINIYNTTNGMNTVGDVNIVDGVLKMPADSYINIDGAVYLNRLEIVTVRLIFKGKLTINIGQETITGSLYQYQSNGEREITVSMITRPAIHLVKIKADEDTDIINWKICSSIIM